MRPRLRKLTLTTHVAVSVGWLGAVVAYLALAIAGVAGQEPDLVRAAYLSMELIGWYVIVACALGASLTGLVQAFGTEWGLLRHYWVLAKFALTIGATVVLFIHMPTVSRMAENARTWSPSSPEFGHLQAQLLVHAAGGLLVLAAVTALSIFKPWGRTRYRRIAPDKTS